MIELIEQNGSTERDFQHKASRPVHPIWQAWMDASCYTHAEARAELGLANGTFYRRIAKAPTRIERLAMIALYEGLTPIHYGKEPMAPGTSVFTTPEFYGVQPEEPPHE